MEGGVLLDEFKRLALFTSGVAELTRNRAEQLVRDMVKSGEVRKDQASSLVKTALEFSKVNRKEFIEAIRSEIKNQVSKAGFVTKRDIERLERRVDRLETQAKKTTAGSGRPPRKSTRKSTAKKTTRRASRPPRSAGSDGTSGS
jgi:polyhydroxyalkanoate synthesis regulator phasin